MGYVGRFQLSILSRLTWWGIIKSKTAGECNLSLLYRALLPAGDMFFHLITRLQVEGTENVPRSGPLIVVANHLSTADPPLLGAVFPREITFMAKDELFTFPSIILIRALGAFSARKFGKSGMALRQALRMLERGTVLGVFPEGKRSLDHHMAKGEIGVAFIALRSGVPIVPVGISGSEYLQSKKLIFRRPVAKVTIGQSFSFAKSTGKLNREQLRETADVIMQRIARVLPQDYRGIYDG